MKRPFVWLVFLGLVLLLAPPLPMASAVVNYDETNTTGQMQAIVQDGGASVIKSTSRNTTVDVAFQDLNTARTIAFTQKQQATAYTNQPVVNMQTAETLSMLTMSPRHPLIKPLVARNEAWYDTGQSYHQAYF